MHRLFGKKKEVAPPPSLDDAAGGLNGRLATLDEKLKAIDNEMRRYKEQLKTAKGPAAANIKKRAMETLKRKRMYEQQRDQLSAQAFNIDQTAFAISSVKDSQTTVAAMKEATKQLKAENKKINLNEIEDMNDDMMDMMEDMEELNEALGRSYTTPDGVEEEDLEAELACLEDELEGEDLFDSPAVAAPPAALPHAPNSVPAQSLPMVPGGQVKIDEYGLPLRA